MVLRRRARHEVSDFFYERKVDLVIFSNFLHEAPADEWINHFQNANKALADDGALLIMEDQAMDVGELPHLTGFLVLSLAELRALFASTDEVQPHVAGNARCSVVTISKAALQGALTGEADYVARLKQAIKQLRDRCLREVTEARTKKAGKGAAHARAMVQFANAELALRNLGDLA